VRLADWNEQPGHYTEGVKQFASGAFALAAVLMPTPQLAGVLCALEQEPQRFTLAIVRVDGRLVPFAAYDDGRWEHAWPEADEDPKGTPSLDKTPSVWRTRGDTVPGVWQVWSSSAADPVPAHVKGVDNVRVQCSVQLALTTDLPAVKRDDTVRGGVAVDSNLPIGSVERVRSSDAQWRTAARAVAANFSRLEAAKAQADRQQLVREEPAPAVQITALYREARSPRSPLYFVAEKKYRAEPSPQDPGCFARTIVTGWLVPTDAGRLTLHDPNVFLTNCDGKYVRTAVPLAVFRVSGRLFWALHELGYEGEAYGIAEIGPSGVRYPITAEGGGC
jgi:hypothetical protein